MWSGLFADTFPVGYLFSRRLVGRREAGRRRANFSDSAAPTILAFSMPSASSGRSETLRACPWAASGRRRIRIEQRRRSSLIHPDRAIAQLRTSSIWRELDLALEHGVDQSRSAGAIHKRIDFFDGHASGSKRDARAPTRKNDDSFPHCRLPYTSPAWRDAGHSAPPGGPGPASPSPDSSAASRRERDHSSQSSPNSSHG